MFQSSEQIPLVASMILFFSIFAGEADYRFGLSALLLFLGMGMLFGSDGLGIRLGGSNIAQFIGMLALSIILLPGGMDTKVAEIEPTASQSVALATLGVSVTTFITGGFIYWLFGLFGKYAALASPEPLLLAAVTSSTDSASVFPVLCSRGVYLEEYLRLTLELESGSNDPMAYMLTLLLIAYAQNGGMSIREAGLSLAIQLSVGAAAGLLLGRLVVLITNKIDIDNESLYPVLSLVTAFFTSAATTSCKDNDYLAICIASLVVGNVKIVHERSMGTFFDGLVWLWQIVMFLTLGLLVSPHESLPVTGVGVMVGVFMILTTCSISVLLCLISYKNFSFRGKLYISRVGLRGTAPIIFATYPMITGIKYASAFFDIVFFIAILSLLIRGTTVIQVAKRLDMVDEPERKDEFGIELPREVKSAMSETDIIPAVLSHGDKLMQLTLSDHTLAIMVKREDRYFVPKGNTELKGNGKLLMAFGNDEALSQTYGSLGVKDYTMKKS